MKYRMADDLLRTAISIRRDVLYVRVKRDCRECEQAIVEGYPVLWETRSSITYEVPKHVVIARLKAFKRHMSDWKAIREKALRSRDLIEHSPAHPHDGKVPRRSTTGHTGKGNNF